MRMSVCAHMRGVTDFMCNQAGRVRCGSPRLPGSEQRGRAGSRGPPWGDPTVRSGAVWSAAGVAVPAYDTLLGNDANDALAATLDMDCSLQHYVGTDS